MIGINKGVFLVCWLKKVCYQTRGLLIGSTINALVLEIWDMLSMLQCIRLSVKLNYFIAY